MVGAAQPGTATTAEELPGLACRGLRAGYFGTEVLHDISFAITEPSVYVVLGPNGAGKTTLFRALAGVLDRSGGEVFVGNQRLDEPGGRDRLHYLSHVDGIPDGLRVREALEFYARVERAGPEDVDRVLGQLEISDLANEYLSRLSAGQRKRVSVARIFLRERSIYLLDEPTANLDPKAAREIRSLVLSLARNKIVLYSSHNLYEAREIGRYLLAMKGGRLALFDRIDNLRSHRFIVGIRTLVPAEALAAYPREGEYYLRELPGPEAVPGLLRELVATGVQVRELREMGNPLEELFL
jgi:ABC-2 type transport system ATP-binding protein